MSAIEVVILDLGGVIVKITWLSQNPLFLAKCKAPADAVEKFFKGETWHAYERGRVSTEHFVGEAVKKLGYQGSDEEFRRDFCEMLEAKLDREVFDVLGRLKAAHGHEVVLWMLSNVNELHYNYLRVKWPGVFSSFLEVFLSFKLGERKPDLAAFKMILEKGKELPKHCLFFDNSEENIFGAKKAGIEARLFTGIAGLKRDLVAAGFKLSET